MLSLLPKDDEGTSLSLPKMAEHENSAYNKE